jgi:FtsH-binding integral membrane protein
MSNVFAEFGQGMTAFSAPIDARLAFIRRTYLHLAGAIGVFVALSYVLAVAGVGEGIVRWMSQGGGSMRWLAVLGGFALLGWLGQAMAHGAKSSAAQYGGLTLYTVGEAFIFSPLLFIANRFAPGVLAPAAAITMIVFAALSAIVLVTKKDFSFLRMFLLVGGLVAFGLILCGAIFGFNLGLWFAGAMVLFACASILYTTSKVLHQYRTDQHVGAALELFAAVALLFWYVLRILMSRRN